MKQCNFCKFEITEDYTKVVSRIEIIQFDPQGKDIEGIVDGKVANLGTKTACNDCFNSITAYFDHILFQSDHASKGEKYLGWMK